ncbi:MAG: FG-GAP-like repeat-containing protein [Planctomycetota bacterium]|jgi:tetratricopeptide (TPR) repeat protein
MTPVQRCGGVGMSILGLWLAAAVGCGPSEEEATIAAMDESPSDISEPASPAPAEPPEIRLVDTAAGAGLTLVHRSGTTGQFRYPEIVTGGACLADLDGDGHLDIYLPQGGAIPGDPPAGDPAASVNRLLLGRGDGSFRDATDGSGAGDAGYGNGGFAADVDGDGDLDLLLTNTGGLVLLRNRGDGRFEDVTAAAGLAGRPGLWLNAAFGDFDGDGDLDAYVANYTMWTPGSDPVCTGTGGLPDYCNPKLYPGAVDLVLRNRGDGTFEDVTEVAGVAGHATRSMGVVILDADGDGHLDLYVANDGEANLLWINDGTGRFREEAMERGCALDGAGRAEAGMGIAVADVDGDGDEDLLVTHLNRETNTLYRNDNAVFTDATSAFGLAWTAPDTGFGVGMPDLDHDGRPDLFLANGGVMRPTQPDDPAAPYALRNRAVLQDAAGGYAVVPAGAAGAEAAAVGPPGVSRGAAFGDVDGDGDIDILVAVKDDRPRLLRNDTPSRGGWIALRPVPRAGWPATIGAGVVLEAAGSPAHGRFARVRPHGSYLGSSDDAVHAGLGPHQGPVHAVVTWPGGLRERFGPLEPGQRHELVRGSGRPADMGDPVAGAAGDPVVAADVSTDLRPAELPPRPLVGGIAAAGPIPPLRVEPTSSRHTRAVFDAAAMEAWAARAGLPKPVGPEGYDAATWTLVHAAMQAAAADPSPATLGRLAMHLHGHGPEAAAIEAYRMAIGLDPVHAEAGRWWHLLGCLHLESGEPMEAVRAFRRVQELDADDAATHGRMAEAWLAAGAAEAAAAAWAEYRRQRPEDAWGALGAARAAEAAGDLDAAWDAATEAERLAPRSEPVLTMRLRLATRRGEAAADARAAIAARLAAGGLEPDLPLVDARDRGMREAVLTRGWLRAAARRARDLGRPAEALELLRLLAQREPDLANTWQAIARLSLELGRMPEAIAAAAEAVDLDPSFAPGWELVARGRLAAGDEAAALEAARRGVAADPAFVGARGTLGLILVRMGRWAEALPELDAVVATQPQVAMPHALRSVCLANLGRLAEARAAADRALAIDPANGVARQVREQLGE